MGPIGSKPLAALSSGLLARKGHARPAMRPQLFDPAASLDDLGWNDMGAAPLAAAPLPPVLVERETLVAKVASAPAPLLEPVVEEAVASVMIARIGRECTTQGPRGKAAFTLRLDGARHLRLRLASAVSHRSAQALVVQALDHLLSTMPEVEALAARLLVKEAHP